MAEDFYRTWFLAMRPWSFIMTAISVTAGSILGAEGGVFYWHLYILTLLGIILIHGMANLLNDYYDVLHGIDTKEVGTAQYRPHPLVEGKIKPQAVLIQAVILLMIALLIGIYLTFTRGWPVFFIGITGILAGIFYTAPPFNYKYKALGEFSAFIMWGPLMVEGACYVQRMSFTLDAFWVSLPQGALVALVLLANNIRDNVHDRNHTIRTVPVLAGKEKSIGLFVALVVLAYVAIILLALLDPLPLWSLIVLLSFPLSFGLLKQVVSTFPIDADARTAQMTTAFGVLLIVSLVIERLL
ncbi:MAG: prenyltransferase [Syntrophales bacterium]|nr:prenyltransferase [Syntrophales bacterium]MDY0045537.1 prenyltransferase [Syntrophales bacterium]